MALIATNLRFSSKLAAMNVVVAINAAKRQRAKSHKFALTFCFGRCVVDAHFFFIMTFRASDFLMRSQQRETGAVVIELRLMPRFIAVANFATAFCQALAKLSGMNLLMARLTALIGKNEAQFIRQLCSRLAPVTGAAGHREMAAAQWKIQLLMFGQRELRRRKTLGRVTTLAAAFVETPAKLAGMRISVTIPTELMRQFFFEIAAAVTFFTTQGAMLAAQWKIGQIMIERTAANIFPTLGRMAFRAGVAKIAAMRVLMTRRTV